ncbi:exo-beta-N-acetylmuramidase NamZ domain-containing protein [Bacteroidota bacterium]
MKLGIDILLKDVNLLKQLKGRRVALLGHPASVTNKCVHTLDALTNCSNVNMVSVFGPQHGMRGDKQDNMIESDNYIDPKYNIPVFSLYGEHRRPTKQMMNTFDILLIDIQDIGTRIYTFITTLLYMLEACAENEKPVWILDRPNPAGRPVEGSILEPAWESFVGAGSIIMRHGLTFGEMARWFVSSKKLKIDLKIIKMIRYEPEKAPGYGWPDQLSWVNPSPNASSLNMARCYPGTVLFEGTTLSEGRGSTTALELVGAPDINFDLILKRMYSLAPDWVNGCLIRPCFFEPTFDLYVGQLCSGLQIHTDNSSYHHYNFKPYRLASLILKSIRIEYPDYPLWRDFSYEYETERLAIDLISGGTFLREWIDDSGAKPKDLEIRLSKDEEEWTTIRQEFLLY